MNFDLSEKQKKIQNMSHRFAREFVKPFDAEMDKKNEINYGIIEKMSNHGIWGLVGPEKYGGAGLNQLCGVICVEELAKCSASIAWALDAHWLCLAGIALFGKEDQKKKYLPKLCSGETLGAFSWTETDAGTDMTSITTKAKKRGDNYILNGNKCFCTNGGLAAVYLIGAVTNERENRKGFSIFIVEQKADGFIIGEKDDKMGVRGVHSTDLILNDVKLSEGDLLGEENQGLKNALNIINIGRLSVGAIGVGTATSAMEESIKYTMQRNVFGKPLIEKQAVQMMIADMDTKINAARMLVYRAADKASKGFPFQREAAQAKYFASEIAMETCNNAVQIHGGIGFIKGHDVERYFRDAKLNQIGEGPTDPLKIMVAKSLIRESNWKDIS